MEKHVFRQIKEDAEKNGYVFDRNVFEMCDELFTLKINTQNNEDELWKNCEDERVGHEKFIYGNEVGLYITERLKDLLYFGQCKRALDFKINGTKGTIRDLFLYEEHERNLFLKKQFVNKLYNAAIARSAELEFNYNNLIIKSSADCIIHDPLDGIEYAVIVKPINGSVNLNKDKLWPKNSFHAKPLNVHLGEVFTELFIHKKKVKLIYTDKNNSANIKVFTFGLKNGNLYFDEEKFLPFSVRELCESLDEIKRCLDSNKIPARSYRKKCNLNIDEIESLVKNDIINTYTANEISNGLEYEHFMCKNCQYKFICDGISTNEVNRR